MKILVIVDPQNDFIRGSLAAENGEEVAERLATYVKNTILIYDKLFITLDTHFADYAQTREGKKLPVPHCVKYTPGWCVDKEIMDAITTKDNKKYTFIEKYSFGSNELTYQIRSLLMSKNIDDKDLDIMIMGFDTDICVINNAILCRNAFPEAKITVNSLCSAGSSKETAKAAIKLMELNHIDIIK